MKELVRENKAAYLLGLHGPDLVFYYRPLGKNPVNQLGVQMHRELASKIFEKGRRNYQEKPSYVLLAYLCGFLCHFMLDSECHPYIGNYMEEHGISHGDIETDFDRYLLARDGYDPTRHNCTRHLIRDLDTEVAIASMFDGVTEDQIDSSILGFRMSVRALQCPCALKAKVLDGIFTLTGQKESLAGMLMTGRPHPECAESRLFLEERLNRAVQPAVEQILAYVSVIDKKEPLNSRLNRDFE